MAAAVFEPPFLEMALITLFPCENISEPAFAVETIPFTASSMGCMVAIMALADATKEATVTGSPANPCNPNKKGRFAPLLITFIKLFISPPKSPSHTRFSRAEMLGSDKPFFNWVAIPRTFNSTKPI